MKTKKFLALVLAALMLAAAFTGCAGKQTAEKPTRLPRLTPPPMSRQIRPRSRLTLPVVRLSH